MEHLALVTEADHTTGPQKTQSTQSLSFKTRRHALDIPNTLSRQEGWTVDAGERWQGTRNRLKQEWEWDKTSGKVLGPRTELNNCQIKSSKYLSQRYIIDLGEEWGNNLQ